MICYGDLFYMDEKVDTEPEVTLAKVFHYAQIKDDIQFKDAGEDKFLDIAKIIPANIARKSIFIFQINQSIDGEGCLLY